MERNLVEKIAHNENEVFVLKRFFRSIETPESKRMKASHKSPEILVEIPTNPLEFCGAYLTVVVLGAFF